MDEARRHEPKVRHFMCLENMYHQAPINRTIPSRLEVDEGRAEVCYEVSRSYWHSAGAAHGSAYFKGLDDAAFFAANSVVESYFVLTLKFEVELLAPFDGELLRAVGTFERREGRKIWSTAELFAPQEHLIARGRGLFIVSQTPLTAEIGYRLTAAPS